MELHHPIMSKLRDLGGQTYRTEQITSNTMSLKGNGGSITTNKIRHLKNYGDVWFDERAITNILCFKNVKQKYRVTYDSSTDGIFTVHKPGQLLHFVRHKDGLHYHDTRNCEITLV